MRNTLINLVALIAIGLALPAAGDTLVLQQGQNSYIGCIDSYVRAEGVNNTKNNNYGNIAMMYARCEHYSPT